ncbi:hypothetical protein L4C34_11625 [Vibrio profundum]|uniref:hypothetical protein n=1 Tax=Vibrio profundum TaxID=2910247 RepID=UPI003D0B989D
MEIINTQHGSWAFEIPNKQYNIIVSRMTGQWNIETAVAGIDALLQLAAEHFPEKEWGVLNDMRIWELCTPEVTEYFNNSVLKFTKLQLKWQAVLPSNQLHKRLVGQYTEVTQGGLITRFFDNEEEGMRWLISKVCC